MFFRRSKTLMGLDIGSSAVKAVELKPAGKGYRVTAIGVEPIPPDSIVDGAIIDWRRGRRRGPAPVRQHAVQGQGRGRVAVG